MPQYVIRRNKKDNQIIFGGAARSLKREPIGSVSAQMSSSGNANNLDLIQTDIGEDTGAEYKLLFDIPFTQFRTRTWNSNKTSLSSKVSYGSTTAAITGINLVTEFQSSDLDSGGGGGVGSVVGINTTGTSFFNNLNISGVTTSTGGFIGTVRTSDLVGTVDVNTQLSASLISYGGVTLGLGDVDATPAFDLSDAHSLPSGVSTTATGILTSGNSTLRLALNDETTVDVDVSALNNVSPVSLASSTSYFYLNNGHQLANNQHDKNNGVVFYGTKLRRGEEMVFAIPAEDLHVGIWNGGNGVTGVTNVNNKSNWSTKWYYDVSDDDWDAKNGTYAGTGVELNKDIVVENGTYAIRFDHQTEKLQLWEITTAYDWLLSSANVGVGATETYIYFSSEESTQASTPGSLPSVSQIRSQDFTIKSYTDSARPGHSFYDGTRTNDVWKSNRSLRPGMKVKFTVPTTASNQYWATAFEGTEDLGSGENNAYQAGEMTWRLTNQERFTAHEDATLNANYTALDGSATLAMPGRNCSWRYNSDNTWDIFDEDTDEVVLTGDDSLDGGDMYPYLLAVSNSEDVLSDYVQYEWEWNKAAWFMEYRDWSSGHNGNTALNLRQNTMPLKTATEVLDTGGGFMHMSNAFFNVTWGEKMRPGQEFIWTQLSINQNGSTKNNMIIGVLDSNFSGYTAGIRFFRAGAVKEQADQDGGFTLAAGIGTATQTAGASMRMQYEHGTNKLVCYKVESGIRTKLGESTSALDGNPIFISMGGDSTRIPTSTTGVQVYGWEIAHEPPNYYNPWNNWRIGGFPENQTGVGPGIHSTGSVLAYSADQVWRHKDGIPAGYKMHWLLPTSHPNSQIGQWSATNASSGLTNLENNDTYWDWGFQNNTSEEIESLKGFTYNTSNSNYTATKWTDPSPGSTKFSIRYHSDNKIDLFDESNSEVIATKDVNGDGNPIFISWAAGGATVSQTAMQDDFFGGGDVGIALTTATV